MANGIIFVVGVLSIAWRSTILIWMRSMMTYWGGMRESHGPGTSTYTTLLRTFSDILSPGLIQIHH